MQVTLLQESEVADVLLLSARGLTYLADVMPSSCSIIVRHQAIPVLCEKMLKIEYIDVAEQSLQVSCMHSPASGCTCVPRPTLYAMKP